MNKATLATIAIALAVAGCEKDTVNKADREREATSSQQVIVVQPSTTDQSTEYKGEGKIVTRKVDVIRIASPFGVSPGEAISRQQPMSIQEGHAPGVNISPGGVATTGNGGGVTSTGGFKWSWLDSIWAAIKRLAWFGVIGLVLLLVLFAVPITRPIATAVVRFFGWLVPLLGGAVESIRARLFKKQRDQVIAGGERFKADMLSKLTPEEFAKLKAAFRAAQEAAQDAGTQEVAKT